MQTIYKEYIEKPKITIIMPFYNVSEELFFPCIKSILQQTYSKYELIIVNDGSSKQFDAVLEKVQQMDDRIRLLHKTNGGVSSARNLGVTEARGEYIAFVDADDVVHKKFLEQALHVAERERIDFVIGAVLLINPNLENFDMQIAQADKTDIGYCVYNKDEHDQLIPSLVASNRLIRFNDGSYINRGPVARLLKTNIAQQVCFPEGIEIGEDIIWNISVLQKCKRVAVANKLWYYYLQNSNSAIHKYRVNAIEQVQKKWLLLRRLLNLNNDKVYNSFCYQMINDTGYFILKRYLLSSECKVSILGKWRLFLQVKNMEPWNHITKHYFLTSFKYHKKGCVLYVLFKCDLYFLYLYLRKRFNL